MSDTKFAFPRELSEDLPKGDHEPVSAPIQVYHGQPDGRFETLAALMRKQKGNYNFDMVREAFELCKSAHGEQKRLSGEPFYYHPMAVACIIVTLGRIRRWSGPKSKSGSARTWPCWWTA